MIQIEATVYKCEFCRKHYLVRHACEKHEKYCPKNPNNWHQCFTCPHLDHKKKQSGEDVWYTEFYCKPMDKQLHSYIAERRGHMCLGDTERMPLSGCPCHPDTIELAQEVASRMVGEAHKFKLTTVEDFL